MFSVPSASALSIPLPPAPTIATLSVSLGAWNPRPRTRRGMIIALIAALAVPATKSRRDTFRADMELRLELLERRQSYDKREKERRGLAPGAAVGCRPDRLPKVERRLDVVERFLRPAAAGHHDLAEAEHAA